jgi:hypothetical protein
MIRSRAEGRRKASTLFVLAFLATGVVCCGSDAGEGAGGGVVEETDSGRPNAAASPDPTSAYLQFAQRVQGTQPDAPLEAADIAEGLRQLAGVVGTLDGARPEVATDLRALAEHVLLNPGSAEVAATVTEALTEVAMVVQKTQPSGAAPVQQAAASLRADMPLPAQSAALRGFFQQVAAALEAP